MRSSLARTFTITSLFAMGVLACRGEPTGPAPVVPPPYVPPLTLAFMKLAPDTLTLMRGDSVTMSLVGTYRIGIGSGIVESPVGDAIWIIEDSTIVRIDTARHLVTALSAGKTVISATKNGGGVTRMTVTVRAPYYIRILPGAMCARVDADWQYTAELYDSKLVRLPDEPVAWSSSDTSVATTSATGFVHPKKAGSAYIVAKMHGEQAWSGLYVDPAPLGTAMTCGGIFPATSKSDTSSVRTR